MSSGTMSMVSLFTAKEAAEYTGKHYQHVCRAANAGDLVAAKVTNKDGCPQWMIEASALEEWKSAGCPASYRSSVAKRRDKPQLAFSAGLDPNEVVAMTGWSRTHVRRAMSSGELRTTSTGRKNKKRTATVADVEDWIKRGAKSGGRVARICSPSNKYTAPATESTPVSVDHEKDAMIAFIADNPEWKTFRKGYLAAAKA